MTQVAESSRELDIEPRHRRRSERRGRGGGGVTLIGLLAGIVIGVLGTLVVSNMASWLNPFGTETKDYSAPVMLEQLRDISEFHAAQGQFQVTIDQEDDVKYVPSVIAGERVQYLAVGSVDGYVDFSQLDEDAITIDEATNSISIELPAPAMTDPLIDLDASHVMNRDRGVVDRVSGVFQDNPTGERELMLLASDKMTAAATESDLLAHTRENTTEMLTTMVEAMGYDNVTITYAPANP